ncbi:MAG: hypothetical protein M1820_009186 [Bogoriella megaspora]|nr:MAG: hypothetical protein M1820_009186 [Bogoriella megaspora]
MPLPTPRRTKITDGSITTQINTKDQLATMKHGSVNPDFPSQPASISLSKLPSPTRSPRKPDSGPIQVDRSKRRSLLPQWRPELSNNNQDVGREAEVTPFSNGTDALKDFIEQQDAQDDPRARFDGPAGLRKGRNGISVPPKPADASSTRSAFPSVPPRGLRKPTIYGDKSQEDVSKRADGSGGQGSTSIHMQRTTSNRNTLSEKASAISGAELRRATSSAAAHKRTQSASLRTPITTASNISSHRRTGSNAGQSHSRTDQSQIGSLHNEAKTQRPPFSTLQQHYTPKKVAPQLSSIGKAATDGAGSEAAPSGDEVQLQTELLQLHILHESAQSTEMQWKKSAERQLRSRFEKVAARYQQMREEEVLNQVNTNFAALDDWLSRGVGSEDSIQLLSNLLHELLSLTNSEGRYSRLADRFDNWFSSTETNSLVSSPLVSSDPSSKFAENLGEDWKAEHAALLRKLAAMSREADYIQDANEGSSIGSVISSCKFLLGGMLEELRLMVLVQSTAALREQNRIDEGLAQIEQDLKTLASEFTPT